MEFSQIHPDEIQVGTILKYNGNVFPNSEFKIVEVFARGTSINGNRYLCGYHEFGEGRISFSYAEGEERYLFSEGEN